MVVLGTDIGMVANKIGLSDKDADITYAKVDLALSG